MFKTLIILAFAIRLILMPISAHSDLFFINAYPNLLLSKNIIDVSSHITSNVGENISYYPPLTYFSFAAFQYLYQYVSSTFSLWMSDIVSLFESGFKGQASDIIKSTTNQHIFRDLALAKVPYLIFDLAAVLVILNAVKKLSLKKATVLVWLFNPVSFYAVYMMGQFEIIPSFFVLLGFFALRKNVSLGIFILGIAVASKNYAFLFILPTILIYGSSWRDRAKLFVIATVPYLIFLLPTILSNAREVIFVLLPKVYLHYRKPLEGWPLYSQIIKYLILTVSLIAILALSSILKLKDKWNFSVGISLAMVLTVFAFAPRLSFHYLLWATPLIILWFKNQKLAMAIIIVQAVSLASYKLLANHLQAGLFAPLDPNYFSKLPAINRLIDQVIPYQIISSLGFFIFFFLNLYLALQIFIDLLFRSEVKIRMPISRKDQR